MTTCHDCLDLGTALACDLGPDVHDPADDLGCDTPVPCPCQEEPMTDVERTQQGAMREKRPSRHALWQRARASSALYDEQDREWLRLMIGHGYFLRVIAEQVLGHRILAGHSPGEVCNDCPCWHCGNYKADPDGDHSCPCPHHDNDCPWHWNPTAPKGSSS